MEIQYYNRKKGVVEIEKVYGESGIKWLYETSIGGKFAHYLAGPLTSRRYGSYQDLSISKRKIKPFISKFNIDMDEYLPEDGRGQDDPYSNFNQFFIRRFKDGKRAFPSQSKNLGHQLRLATMLIQIYLIWKRYLLKERYLSPKQVLKDERWYPEFAAAQCCLLDYVQLITTVIISLIMAHFLIATPLRVSCTL